ncbi:putative bifunctional diguanylate cyclase/phosphodiesterase [Aureimonas fodinaquatilis]|nr:EAL domain-containing protein [Aureimonas fodinaquatilis]
MNSIRHFFPRQYVPPVALLIITTFVALFSLLYYLTAVQDRMDTERDRQTISSGLQSLVEFAVRDLQDYAVWDDAARALLLRFDPKWADENVSVYLGNRQDYSHIFIIENGERTIYSFYRGSQSAAPMDAYNVLGRGLARGITDAAFSADIGEDASGGYTRQGSQVFLYAAADIVPLSPEISMPAALRRTLVVARELDPVALDRLARRYGTAPLELMVDAQRAENFEAVPVVARDGIQLAEVAWLPDRPGTALMHQMLPGYLLITVVTVLLAGAILNRARRSTEALKFSQGNVRYLAYHDALTGLPNRRRLLDSMRGKAGLGPENVLLYMDLDGFKEANDVYGHAIGDDLLIEAGRRIRKSVRSEDLVARTGGDEFAVLLAPVSAGPSDMAESILTAFEPPFNVSGYSVNLGISIGAATSQPGITAEELMRRGDVAMYAAKSRGKRGWLSYDPSFDEANRIRHMMEGMLRVAVDSDQIEVAFQPIVEATSGRIDCVEALARWDHPALGSVAPDHFIRVAEQSGLINELGRKVLVKACRLALDWNVRLSVNLSPAQFWDRDLVSTITNALSEIGFPAERLDLEITERYLLRRPAEAEQKLRAFRQLGIRISLDDFGTGYASIGYLQRLSLDRIKMDKSFVMAAQDTQRAFRLAAAIVELGTALGLPVTAEGVETEEQAQLMQKIGCSHLQGWLYGHALTPDEVERRLQEPHLAAT